MLIEVEMLEVTGTPVGVADRLKISIGRCLTKQPVGTVTGERGSGIVAAWPSGSETCFYVTMLGTCWVVGHILFFAF